MITRPAYMCLYTASDCRFHLDMFLFTLFFSAILLLVYAFPGLSLRKTYTDGPEQLQNTGLDT